MTANLEFLNAISGTPAEAFSKRVGITPPHRHHWAWQALRHRKFYCIVLSVQVRYPYSVGECRMPSLQHLVRTRHVVSLSTTFTSGTCGALIQHRFASHGQFTEMERSGSIEPNWDACTASAHTHASRSRAYPEDR